MLIAISQRNDQNKYGESVDSLENSYVKYLEKFGIKLLTIPNSAENVDYYFDKFPIAGVILSGGNDVDPKIYGMIRNRNSSFSVMRDRTEQKMLELAVEKKLPVLGICRGMQMINVFFGGKLVDLRGSYLHLPAKNHEIKMIYHSDSLGETTKVNSYHNQGLNLSVLSNKLKSFATDGEIIEGIYHPDLPIAGIQWHPERTSPNNKFNEKLVKAFVDGELFWKDIKENKEEGEEEKKEEKRNMKAIILAAGMGTRLGRYTENLPKCMLNFNGKTLIARQVEQLRKVGITDITIVKGYQPEKINVFGVKYYLSKDFANTNMVETLFSAEEELTGEEEVLVCYADILYEEKILKKIMNSEVDVGVTVDEDYWEYWKARADNPEDDMESLIIDEEGKIIELGNTKCTRKEAKVRYVGLIKFSKKGVEALKKVYHENKERYFQLDQPWLRSKSFKKAYMTCMLQAIINSGQKVEPIIINRGWLEFDTVEDYEKYTQWLENGSLNRFFNF